jgi:hypothetical protein
VAHSGGKTKTADVDEETISRLIGEGPTGDTAHVHCVSVAGKDCAEGRANAAVKAQRATEIAPGTARNHGESGLGIAARLLIEEAVHHLVERAVATHTDDEIAPFPESVSNQGRGMQRSLSPVPGKHAEGSG